MKRWKNIVFPLLTLAAVVIAALVPQQLSALRDAGLAGSVHTEPLAGENNFSVWTSDLSERINLAVQWQDGNGSVSSIHQQLEGDSLREAEKLALSQLGALVEHGILPPETVPEQLSSSSGERVYLWTPGNLGGAGFLDLWLADTGRSWSVSLLLDEESGQPVRLELIWPALAKYEDWPAELGEQFLDRLELSHTLYGAGDHEAIFTISPNGEWYMVLRAGEYLCITPQRPLDKPEDLVTNAFSGELSQANEQVFDAPRK